MGKKKIKEGKFIWLQYLSDTAGVGYIRSILPSLVLNCWRYNKLTFDVQNLMNFVQDPNFYRPISIVKFQRSATKRQLQLFKYFKQNVCKQTKTTMVYEIDDNLFDIPESNFAHGYYEQNKPYIEEMLKMVDGITVSTPYLKKLYYKYNKNISVVRNRLAKCMWGEPKKYEYDGRKRLRIIYPGSQNHFAVKGVSKGKGDIDNILLKYIQSTTDKFEWVFVGGIPEELKSNKNVVYYNWIDYISYPHFMKNMYADMAIAPLAINEFNKAKSDLKMLEYVICGYPGIYTNIEPYKKATMKANTEEQMIEIIEELSKDPDKRKEVWEKDYKKMKNNLFLEENRKMIINEHLRLFNREI